MLRMSKYLLSLLLCYDIALLAQSDKEWLTNLLKTAKSNNLQIKAATRSYQSSTYKAESTGYLPDPTIKINYFTSPIETRNGPQKSNITLNQQIPWAKTLNSMEKKAEAVALIQKEKVEVLELEVSYKVKELVYKYILLKKKIENRKRMLLSLNKFTQVLIARISVGRSSQAGITRVNIETAKLNQNIRDLEASALGVEHNIKRLMGSYGSPIVIPKKFAKEWLQFPQDIKPDTIDFSTHPLIKISKQKIERATAGVDLEQSKKFPMLGVSASWYQIDKPEGAQNSDSGKDAWAVGASVSIPIWRGKYSALERSQKEKKVQAKQELSDTELLLRAELSTIYDKLHSTNDIIKIYKNDIIPQANQSLQANQRSYQKGSISFDRVIDDHLRLIRFEDQLEANIAKLATLKAGIEKVLGKAL